MNDFNVWFGQYSFEQIYRLNRSYRIDVEMCSTKQATHKFRCNSKLTTSSVVSYLPVKDKGLRRCLLLAFSRTVKLHRVKQSVSNDIFSSAPRKYGSIKREQSNTIWTNEQRRSGNGSETWSQWRVSVYIRARVTGPLPLSQFHTAICWCFVTKLTVICNRQSNKNPFIQPRMFFKP